MNKLMLAAGCSITHGFETVYDRYDRENCKFSYANLIAQQLGINCVNIAYPLYSNEMIFHSAVAELTTKKYSHCIIGWTSLYREVLHKDNCYWLFSINSAKIEDLNKPIDDVWVRTRREVKLVTNRKGEISKLYDLWANFRNKIELDDYSFKLKNYQLTIRSLCQSLGVHLVEVDVLKNNEDSTLYNFDPDLVCVFENNTIHHPKKESHEYWAQELIKKFYNNEQT